MATLEELIVEVTRIIQDTSYTGTIQAGFLNQAQKEVAGDPRVFLPDLETEKDVSTSTSVAYVSLPDTYQKNLTDCYNSSRHRHIKIYGSLEILQKRFSHLDQAGYISGVAIRGANLHYHRIPSTSETLALHFYRLPVDMDDDNDSDGIPAHLVRPLLVNHVCAGIFSEIEQDLQGKKINTIYHEAQFEKNMVKLIAFIGPVARQPVDMNMTLDFEEYL